MPDDLFQDEEEDEDQVEHVEDYENDDSDFVNVFDQVWIDDS